MTADPIVENTKANNTVQIRSELFGALEVPEEVCLNFEEGLLGFSDSQRFVLLPATPDGVLWLHGVDDPSLAFLTIDPCCYMSDYSLDLPEADQAKMGLVPNSETAVLAIITLPQAGNRATANLQGPLVIDFTTRRGWQVIVADSEYGTRHSIDVPLLIPVDG